MSTITLTKFVADQYHSWLKKEARFLPAGALLTSLKCKGCTHLITGGGDDQAYSDGHGGLYCENCVDNLETCSGCEKAFTEQILGYLEDGSKYCSDDCLNQIYENEQTRRDDEYAASCYYYH